MIQQRALHVNTSSALGKSNRTEQMGLGRHRQQDKDKDLAETSTPKVFLALDSANEEIVNSGYKCVDLLLTTLRFRIAHSHCDVPLLLFPPPLTLGEAMCCGAHKAKAGPKQPVGLMCAAAPLQAMH